MEIDVGSTGRSRSCERRRAERAARSETREQQRVQRHSQHTAQATERLESSRKSTDPDISKMVRALELFGCSTRSDVQSVADDVGDLREDLIDVRKDVGDLRIDHERLAKEVAELRQVKPSQSSAASTTSTVSGIPEPIIGELFQEEDFIPTEVRVGNLCGFKVLPSEQIDRPTAALLGKCLLDGLQERDRHLVSFLAPGRTNFRLTFKVVGGRAACDMVCNQFRFIVQKERLEGRNGRSLTVSVEQSTERRRAWSMFCAAKDSACSCLGPEDEKWESENRGTLSLFSTADGQVFGEYDKEKRSWTWHPEACLRLDFPFDEHAISL